MDIRQHAISNYMHRFRCHYVITGLGPTRPQRPLAFVQPCPVGVTPLFTANFMPILLANIGNITIHFEHMRRNGYLCTSCQNSDTAIELVTTIPIWQDYFYDRWASSLIKNWRSLTISDPLLVAVFTGWGSFAQSDVLWHPKQSQLWWMP